MKDGNLYSLSICLSSPASIYLRKVNNRNTRKRCEICSKLTIKTPKRRQWRRFGVFIVNFEHISHLCSSVSVVNFEHVIAGWVLTMVFIAVHNQIKLKPALQEINSGKLNNLWTFK